MGDYGRKIANILARLEPSLPGGSLAASTAAVIAAAENLVDFFDGRSTTFDVVDPAMRFAYVYLYAGARAAFLHDIIAIRRDKVFIPLANAPGPLRVCTLGAGPGVDALAVDQLISDDFGNNRKKVVHAMGDLFPQWRPTAEAFVAECANDYQLSAYFEIDLTDTMSIDRALAGMDADLVLLPYVLAQAKPDDSTLRHLLKAIAAQLQVGDSLILMDQIPFMKASEVSCDEVMFNAGFQKLGPGRPEYSAATPQTGLFHRDDLKSYTDAGLPSPNVVHSYMTFAWIKRR